MTIYEQIQRALDYMEENLFDGIMQESAAREAGMSLRGFRYYFQNVTGYSFKSYIVKRRLTRALEELESTDKQILDIALDIGYQSHEAFTRVFKEEFKVSPKNFRQNGPGLKKDKISGLEKIRLFKEIYMGVIVKELKEMMMVAFEGHGPGCEDKAIEKMEKWRAKKPASRKGRTFGHNINAKGELDCNPQNEGYKVLVSVDDLNEAEGEKTESIKPGKFVVTGIEGNFETDPEGNWIRSGWDRMNSMVKEKGYRVKENARWFEEVLEPTTPGNLRLDLYLEIE